MGGVAEGDEELGVEEGEEGGGKGRRRISLRGSYGQGFLR